MIVSSIRRQSRDVVRERDVRLRVLRVFERPRQRRLDALEFLPRELSPDLVAGVDPRVRDDHHPSPPPDQRLLAKLVP